MNLYEINKEYAEIMNELIDDETGEINLTALAKLENNEMSLENKCVSTAYWLKNSEAMVDAIDKVMAEMRKRKASIEKNIEYNKNRVLEGMIHRGITEVSCPQFAIKIKKNPVSTDIKPGATFQDEYMRITVKKEPDKTLIKAALQSGAIIEGAELVQRNRLEIK